LCSFSLKIAIIASRLAARKKASLFMNNLAELLAQHLAKPECLLYRQFIDEGWCDFNAADIAAMAARWQAAFRREGCVAGDRVALCMKNGVHWIAADMAALGLGLIVVPTFVDDNAENIAWCLQDSGARLLISDHARFLEKLQVNLQTLPTIVVLRDDATAPAVPASTWLPPADAAFEVRQTDPDGIATVVYTSGTVGKPKGVMLSHANILGNIRGIPNCFDLTGNDRFLSLLPLSHMFERTAGYYLPLLVGAQVVYARGINYLADDLREQRPTIVMAVPRIFERLLARIEEALATSPIKRMLFHLAVAAGWRSFNGDETWLDRLLLLPLRQHIARPILERFGGRMRVAVMGGAALELRVARAFIGLGLPMLQGYGLTETSPVIAVNRLENNDPSSVGPPLQGVEIRVNEAGELLVRGSLVMKGYWNNPEATQQAIDEADWFNTGDVVEIKHGRIYIRGRSKNILVLSNAEKIAPEDVEKAILDDPAFEQVMLVGEGKPCLVLLAVTQETDEKLLTRHANARLVGLPRYARVRRVIATQDRWELENGLLTPTLKVKRRAVYERYRERIEAAYAGLLNI